MNKICIIGRLTADPQLTYTQGGAPFCKFSIAYNEVYKKDSGEKVQNVSYFNVVAWNGAAENITKYFHKGQRIGVDGKLQQRRWNDKDTGANRSVVEIVLDKFDFIETAKNEDQEPKPTEGKKSAYKDGEPVNQSDVPAQSADNPFSDKDIPF
jgi:single-strand DNA-binding protein